MLLALALAPPLLWLPQRLQRLALRQGAAVAKRRRLRRRRRQRLQCQRRRPPPLAALPPLPLLLSLQQLQRPLLLKSP